MVRGQNVGFREQNWVGYYHMIFLFFFVLIYICSFFIFPSSLICCYFETFKGVRSNHPGGWHFKPVVPVAWRVSLCFSSMSFWIWNISIKTRTDDYHHITYVTTDMWISLNHNAGWFVSTKAIPNGLLNVVSDTEPAKSLWQKHKCSHVKSLRFKLKYFELVCFKFILHSYIA